jgi:DNA-binding transcriptional MerR regulator
MRSVPFTLEQLARAVRMPLAQVRRYRELGLLQAPRRQRGRSPDLAFHGEHVERLLFIKRAVAYGFTSEDIKRFVDETALVTCADVYRLSIRRLEVLRSKHGMNDPRVTALESLAARCSRTGARQACQVLAALAGRWEGAQVPNGRYGLGAAAAGGSPGRRPG